MGGNAPRSDHFEPRDRRAESTRKSRRGSALRRHKRHRSTACEQAVQPVLIHRHQRPVDPLIECEVQAFLGFAQVQGSTIGPRTPLKNPFPGSGQE
jgi:hypothetical protein